ncbi:Prosaposin [Bagarius yarrelli]|uniref:Prosaposin n=1 Tax=Bagarius yarrelli TaxID=175774 RepID=A0A556U2P9_BAGYA|nr:Prosaposin [Bagarius yarrelli]
MEILKDLLADEEFQMKLKNNLEKVCDLLPELIANQCRSEVDTNLRLTLTFIAELMNSGEVCTQFNLCEGDSKLQIEDILINFIQKTITAPPAMSSVIILLDEVCSVLPIFLSGQCSRIVQRSVKKLFEELLNAASPNSICSVLRLCQVASPLSDCDSCLTLLLLSRLHLGSNATQAQVTSFLRSVCQSHPGILPKCESFTQRYDEKLLGILGTEAVALDACEKADLCMGSKMTEKGNISDPCTLGPSYSCRDLQTAHTCGYFESAVTRVKVIKETTMVTAFRSTQQQSLKAFLYDTMRMSLGGTTGHAG